MKIFKEDQNLMVLRDRKILAFVAGVIFFLTGIALVLSPDFFTNQPPPLLGFAVILLSGVVVALVKITIVKLDKSTNKLSILQKGLTGQSSREYDLDQVKEIELSVAYNTPRKDGEYPYQLAFIFNSGEVVLLNPDTSSIIKIMGKRIIPEKPLGEKIASFLGVPFQERRLPTVGETLSTISSVVQNAPEKEIEK